jgi:hypothetical protein
MFDLIADVSQQYNPKSLKITLTETPPPRFSVIPFRNEKVAVMSITRETSEELNGIYQAKGFLGGFLVEEAVPVAYKKVWENKTPTPGICLLTLFHRKPTIGEGTFIQRWHEGHTPLSLRLHPLWNYNRNVVKQKLTDGPVWYDGIVEEQFKTRRKLLNPMHFFGPWWKVPYHMLLVYKDTISFIDMKRLETYLATEYHFKT